MFLESNNILVLDMKQEELFKALIKELFELDTTHQEYQDNDTHFVVDSEVNGNTLTIKVELFDINKDKKEFEHWLEGIDDELFSEVLEKINREYNLGDLDELYNSKDYQVAIDTIKKVTKEVINEKVLGLQRLVSNI